MGYLNRFFRIPFNLKNRAKLRRRSVSLIANNCIGGFICHDLGLQFKSPFVNLWMRSDDYLKLLCDLEGYLGAELNFIKEEHIDYPVGLLRDVKIYFQHYATEEEARQKWNQRLARVDFENLYVLFVEIEGTSYENLAAFDQLPFPNKAMLTHRPYSEFQNAFPVPGYEESGYVGPCYHYRNGLTGMREYDAFDYVSWINRNANG